MSTADTVLALLATLDGARSIDARGLAAPPGLRCEIVDAAAEAGGDWSQGQHAGAMHCRFPDGSQISMFDKDLGPSRMLVFSVVPL
jgi:hypothetical protein